MFASIPEGYATAANAAHGQQLPCLINGSTTAAGMERTPIRVQPDAQNTGSVGKLTRLDRQHDHSIRQLVPSTDSCAQPLIPALCPVQKVFKPFWAPALVRQALPAIIFAALRRSRGPALFRGLRPCPSPGAPFWPSGLTRRSSRPAYGGRLTLAVSFLTKESYEVR